MPKIALTVLLAVSTLAATTAVRADTIAVSVQPKNFEQRRLLGQRFAHFIRDTRTGAMTFEAGSDDWLWLQAQGFHPIFDSVRSVQLIKHDQAMAESIPGFECYPTVDETYLAMDRLVAAFPTLAAKIDIGDSWEKTAAGGHPGSDLFVLKITNSAIVADKPKFFAISAVHARELVTAPLNTAFAQWLLNHYGIDPVATWLIDHNEFHLLLQANPDGRQYVEAGNFSQRKNRHFEGSGVGTQVGVDLNRNYPFGWGAFGASSGSITAATYRGAAPGSEPENQAVVAYLDAIFPDRRPGAAGITPDELVIAAASDTRGLFLDLHSFGNLVVWPWGMTDAVGSPVTGNNTALVTLGRRLAWFNDYVPEQASALPADGASIDHAYAMLGLPAFTIELGGATFQSDCTAFANDILPRNLAMLKYAARILHSPYLLPSGPDARSITIDPDPAAAGATIRITAIADDTRFNHVNGVEETQVILGAAAYVDGVPWQANVVANPMHAVDGSFDDNTEHVEVDLATAGLAPGRHLLYVQARDSGGVGAPNAAFFTISGSTRFGDGFE